jgi:hypothetical protein
LPTPAAPYARAPSAPEQRSKAAIRSWNLQQRSRQGRHNKTRRIFQNPGTFSFAVRLTVIKQKSKGEYTMDGLGFDPSALLIVGMLIGVVYTLL